MGEPRFERDYVPQLSKWFGQAQLVLCRRPAFVAARCYCATLWLLWYNGWVMAEMDRAEVRLGKQGRLVIPAPLREALSLHPGSRLVARVVDGRLVLEPRQRLWQSVRKRFEGLPTDSSLADALIAERRAEAQREEIR